MLNYQRVCGSVTTFCRPLVVKNWGDNILVFTTNQ